MAVIQGMQGLAMDVQDLKGATYRSWVGPDDWTYVTETLKFRKEYGKMCQQAKGTKTIVGHVKNYVMAGLFMAYKRDKRNAAAEQEELVRAFVAVKAVEYDSYLREISAWERRFLVAQA